jgi:hypothetical protein
MGLFAFLKTKKEASSDVLTKEESEIAFQATETAAVLMRSQYECAVLLSGQEYKSEVIEFSFPFAFGILISALEGAGISWIKAPHVGIYYIEKWLQSSEDSKALIQIMLKSGTEKKYSKYRDAGMQAFSNFIHHDDNKPYKAKELAQIIGIIEK